MSRVLTCDMCTCTWRDARRVHRPENRRIAEAGLFISLRQVQRSLGRAHAQKPGKEAVRGEVCSHGEMRGVDVLPVGCLDACRFKRSLSLVVGFFSLVNLLLSTVTR